MQILNRLLINLARRLSTSPFGLPKSAMSKFGTLSLAETEGRLNAFLNIKTNAEEWDNVGLLIGSGIYSKTEFKVGNILLCNDLTQEVVNEAVETGTNLIIAYHPPLFKPFKRLAYNDWKEKITSCCIANGICVYSPHTALDSIHGGINDFLASCFKSNFTSTPEDESVSFKDPKVRPIKSSYKEGLKYTAYYSDTEMTEHDIPIKYNNNGSFFKKNYKMDNKAILFGFDYNNRLNSIDYNFLVAFEKDSGCKPITDAECSDYEHKKKYEGASEVFWPGAGRILTFEEPVSMDFVKNRLEMFFKSQIKLKFDTESFGNDNPELRTRITYIPPSPFSKSEVCEKPLKVEDAFIKSIGICVGSGASLFDESEIKFDCVITGEMSHHEILNLSESGTAVFLLGHQNSEMHFLPIFKEILKIVLAEPGPNSYYRAPKIFITKSPPLLRQSD